MKFSIKFRSIGTLNNVKKSLKRLNCDFQLRPVKTMCDKNEQRYYLSSLYERFERKKKLKKKGKSKLNRNFSHCLNNENFQDLSHCFRLLTILIPCRCQ